jgi:hypothetical protein
MSIFCNHLINLATSGREKKSFMSQGNFEMKKIEIIFFLKFELNCFIFEF